MIEATAGLAFPARAQGPAGLVGRLGVQVVAELAGDITTVVPRTKLDVTETSPGLYRADLVVDQVGVYVVRWDVDGTAAIAEEDLAVNPAGLSVATRSLEAEVSASLSAAAASERWLPLDRNIACEVGNVIALRAAFTEDGEALDPDAVACTVRRPRATDPITGINVTRQGDLYTAEVLVDEAGRWTYRFVGSVEGGEASASGTIWAEPDTTSAP